MKTVVTALVAVAGLATAANAQVRAGLDVMVSTDGGATWASKANVLPGTTVMVGIFGRFENGYGFGGGVFRMRSDDKSAGDGLAFAGGTATGRVSPFDFGAATNAIFSNAGGFRLDANADAADAGANAGATFNQRSPASAGVAFSTANPCLGMLLIYTVDAGNNAIRTIDMAIDQIKGNAANPGGLLGVFTSSGATSTTQTAAIDTHAGQINVIPTPGALALVGLGGLIAGRRRR